MRSTSEELNEIGFVVVRNCFSALEMMEFERLYESAAEAGELRASDRFARGDFVAQNRLCWPLATSARLAALATNALDAQVAWIQQADIHLNVGSTMHRDCVDRVRFGSGPDWESNTDRYAIVRMAIYLDDSEESGSRFIACPGSHRLPLTSPTQIDTTSVDCLIFDPRLLHGSTQPTGQKRAMFFTYGVPNQHSRRLQSWFVNERSADLGYRPIPEDLAALLDRASLRLV